MQVTMWKDGYLKAYQRHNNAAFKCQLFGLSVSQSVSHWASQSVS